MISAWTGELKGAWPPWDKLRALRVQRIYVPWVDATSEVLEGIVSQHFGPGFYTPTAMARDYPAATMAAMASAKIKDTGFNDRPCSVDFNAEYPQREVYVPLLWRRWRERRPRRTTGWCFEPMQGGWIKEGIPPEMKADPFLTFKPETFLGEPDMASVAPDEVKDDVAAAGVPRARIELIRDAAHLPFMWSSGTIFTTDRL